MFTEQIKKQHEQIKKALRELQEDVYNVEELSRNALWIALKMGNLSGILTVHLKFEDDYLYPCLLENNVGGARQIAKEVLDKIGELADTFKAYQKKYLLSPNIISEQAERFRDDTLQIIAAILERIETEERDIYNFAGGTVCFRPGVYKRV